MNSNTLDLWYKKGKELINKITSSEPEIHTEELVGYIEKKTLINKNIILNVLLAEEDFLKEKGIMR